MQTVVERPARKWRSVQLARHRDEAPPRWFLFRRTRIHDNCHQSLLVYVIPATFIASS